MRNAEKIYSLYYYVTDQVVRVLSRETPTQQGVTGEHYQAKCIDDEEFNFLEAIARQSLAFSLDEPRFPPEMDFIGVFNT